MKDINKLPPPSVTITEAAVPPNINAADYSFAKKDVRHFDSSGTPSPAGRKDTARTDWDSIPKRDIRFNDVHCHMHAYDGTGHDIADIIMAALQEGIGHFSVTPIPTTLVSTKNDKERYELYKLSHHCGEHYYVPQSMANIDELSPAVLEAINKTVELRVDASVDDNLVHQIYAAVAEGKIKPEHLDMMDPALTGIHLGSPRVTKDILQTLWRTKNLSDQLAQIIEKEHGPEAAQKFRLRLSLIGEVTLRKELVETLFAGKTQADLKSNIAPTREALRLAGVIGMPWVMHCDSDKPESLKSDSEKGKPPKYLEDIKALYRSCPNTDIIWAHGGGLGRFVKAGKEHVNELHKFMEDPTLSHVKLDISWSQVAKQVTQSPESTKDWAEFLCKYKDRILFGSDTLTPQKNEKWTETFDMYEKDGLFEQMNAIDPTAADTILKENYKKVVVAARSRIDAFVDHVLPHVIEGMQNIAGTENVDVEALRARRDDIFAEKAETHPELQAVMGHFKEREVALPEVPPPAESSSASDNESVSSDKSARIRSLEDMLEVQQSVLREVVESLNALNTELKAANEESGAATSSSQASDVKALISDLVNKLGDKQSELQQKIDANAVELQGLRDELTQAQTNAAATKIQFAWMRHKLNQAKSQIAQSDNAITQKDAQIQRLTAQRQVMHQRYAEARTEISNLQTDFERLGGAAQQVALQLPKDRQHKFLKGVGNLVTLGSRLQNYKFGSELEGDAFRRAT